MIIVICIVKTTRSQNPEPNHCAAWIGEFPIPTAARYTTRTATIAKANASGNQRSNQFERRNPVPASQELTDDSSTFTEGNCIGVFKRRELYLWFPEAGMPRLPSTRKRARQINRSPHRAASWPINIRPELETARRSLCPGYKRILGRRHARVSG